MSDDDKVSVEAFDKVAYALLGVIKDDASMLETLQREIDGWAAVSKRVQDELSSVHVELAALKAKISQLMDVCEAQEAYVVEHSLSRDEATVDICDIREIFEP